MKIKNKNLAKKMKKEFFTGEQNNYIAERKSLFLHIHSNFINSINFFLFTKL